MIDPPNEDKMLGVEELVMDAEIKSNDPMVVDAAKAILARSLKDGVQGELESLATVSTRLAEAAIAGLEDTGWI